MTMILSKKLILTIKEWRMQWVIPSDARQRTGYDQRWKRPDALWIKGTELPAIRSDLKGLERDTWQTVAVDRFCHFGNVAVICLSDMKPSISACLFMTNSNKMKYCLDWRLLKSSMTRQPWHWPFDVAWCLCKNPKRFVSEDLRLKQDSWLKEAGMKLYLGPSER